jgi:hypothetical protein
MRELLQSNPLYIAGLVLFVLLVVFLLWKARRPILIVVLLVAIAAAVVWLARMGPIGR